MTTEELRAFPAFICDMDGVIYHGNRLLPGVAAFIAWLRSEKKTFLFLTNSGSRTPLELCEKMRRLGLDVPEQHFYTSALATAAFLADQCPGGSAFVIGDSGISNALYDAGFSTNDVNPDYVVVSESSTYNYEKLCHAVRLVAAGAKLIGTNPDVSGPVESGLVPATGALMAPIEMTTGAKAYYVGKPNPLMMRHALKRAGCRREEAVVIGDRMDTDVLAGIEAGLVTILVLSGVTTRDDLKRFAYRPHAILEDVGALLH